MSTVNILEVANPPVVTDGFVPAPGPGAQGPPGPTGPGPIAPHALYGAFHADMGSGADLTRGTVLALDTSVKLW